MKEENFIGKGIIKERSSKQVAEMARSNHLWLNVFSCINPTEKFKAKVGGEILQMLNDESRLLHKEKSFADMLYLSINKS